ncbi:type I polyketide synthase, partial [Streptomyces humidus]
EDGLTVDWTALIPEAAPVDLPTYPFQHQRYWLDPAPVSGGHPLIDMRTELAGGRGVLLAGRVSVARQPWLADHRVGGAAVLPGTAILELVAQAAESADAATVEDLVLETPLVLPERGEASLQVAVGAFDAEGRADVVVHAKERGAETGWTRHAAGTLLRVAAGAEPAVDEQAGVWPPRGAESIPLGDVYVELAARGLAYGPAFRGLRAAWRGPDGTAYGEVEAEPAADGYRLHPALLDAALHVVTAAGLGGPEEGEGPRLPFSWSGVRFHAGERVGATLRVKVVEIENGGGVTVTVTGEDGALLMEVDQLSARPVSLALLDGERRTDDLFRVVWNRTAVPSAPDTGLWMLPGGTPEHLAELATALDAGTATPRAAVLPWAPETGADVPQEAASRARAVLGVIRRWLGDPRFEQLPLVVLTEGAAPIADPVSPAGATVQGLIRAASAENPGRFLLVDLDGLPASADRLPDLVAAGLPEAAVRSGEVHVPSLVPVETRSPAPVPVKEGTVVVTGASGALATLIVRHLVEAYGVRSLLLLSRSGAGEYADLDAEVRTVACDVTDRSQLEKALNGVPVVGVVHAAGVLRDGLAADMSDDALDAVLAPKVVGAWNLHLLTRDLPLDFFALFSSASGLLGGAGQANYAAANAFLDALAHHRRSQGLPAVSLAWGMWDTPVGGMAAALGDADRARLSRTGANPLTPEQGLGLYDAALAGTDALTVAVPLDLAVLKARAQAGDVLPPLLRGLVPHLPKQRAAQTAPADDADALRRRLAEADPAAREQEVLVLVRTHVSAVLGHTGPERVQAETQFKEIGFDSLTAVELRNRLGRATGLRLPTTLVFDYPTPMSLAHHLVGELVGDLPSAAELLLQELDRIETALSDGVADKEDEAVRRALTAKLTRLSSYLTSRGPLTEVGDSTALADDSEADEVFSFIDRTFGSLDSE